MQKSVFSEPACHSTIFLSFTALVTYKYLQLRLQVFVANLQQIPQLSHYMGYSGCGLSVLARSGSAQRIHRLMCECLILVGPEIDGGDNRDVRGK